MSMHKKIVWLPYDMDTAIGINNDGQMVFGYELEDIDHQTGGENIFNGQDSVVWKNIRAAFGQELAEMYRTLRSGGNFSYEAVEQAFEEHQAKWSEAIFNEDAEFKYIKPFVESSANYLAMLLGSKAEQRKWWLYNRFRYIDSKYIAGDARNDTIFLRPYAAADITLTPYADIYATIAWDATITQERAPRNYPVTLHCPYASMNGNIVTVYSSSQLAQIGDLAPLKVGQIDISNATRLQALKIGDSDSEYENTNLYALTFGANVLLKTIDARGCSGLGDTSMTGHTQTTVDISGCSIIEHVYMEGTKIQGITLPNGGVLKTLHLPNTIRNLTIMNQPAITSFAVEGNDYSGISTLRLENVSTAVDEKAILRGLTVSATQIPRVRLIGIHWECTDAAEIDGLLDLLDTMKGLDESGGNVEQAQVSGTIHVPALTGAQKAEFESRYPYINYDADYLETTLTLKTWDGSSTVAAITCYNGVPQSAIPSVPSRSQTDQYTFTAVGWNTQMDAQTADASCIQNVTEDRTVYAAYSRTVRTYTITWNNADATTLETDTNVPYGARPEYNGSTPTYQGQTATGWNPAIANVTGNQTYTATYLPIYQVRFYNGTTLMQTKSVQQGSEAVYDGAVPVDPSGKGMEFLGWAISNGAHTANAVLTNIQSNMDVYAAFKADAPSSTDVTNAYGVEWTYTNSSPAVTRVGLAASFTDPTPATSVSGSGSSPFDNIQPWAGMKRYNVINGEISYSQDDSGFDETLYDTVVYIPEFWYTAIKDTTNNKWLWAISPTEKTGYQKHPGSGRYVGRFHTGGDSTEVFTKGGIAPLASTTQGNFRTYSHNKGSNWYMMDLASWSAIQMLYLIEFATFYSQDALGKGWNTRSVGTMGGTTGAAYHTIKTTGAHNQYRWIEDPFSNVLDNIDGFIASSRAVYAGVSDTGYTGTTNDLANTGITLPSSGAIQGFGYSADTPWAFIPDTASGSDYTTYVTDRVGSNAGTCVACVGGSYSDYDYYGFFYVYAYYTASGTSAGYGSRLLYIP
ncbi:MAG: hypothetical protein IJV14_06510 [Lachnospiraceae bacterium]|nr:hypothetical protein [Lachnospiraceae bacterium]